ncbi:LexA family transcriptional regulator [Runella sp. MFBS21]|jgi:transcriptional regulator with XRE-family HTH domain|uniref:XRE family transcriptional regulator n=1 Tax=Runella TaxID=105 RepID=UPI000429E3DB|nr:MULTISPECIES: LexA family transcriptional regulator [Runella]MDF7820048.1 LexA family transcriptional regulator [Runella sp. MFBS21]
MQEKVNNFAQNLSYLRGKLAGKVSQQRLADELGMKKSTLAAYELGRAEPSFEDLIRLAAFFGVTIDGLLRKDLSREFQPFASNDIRVLVTTVDSQNHENIEFVPVRAMGGYAEGYGDIDYINRLPTFQLPFLSRERKYRAFPYEGDSMPPLREGAVVFGEYIDRWDAVKSGTICLVVTKDEGVVLKKVFNYLEEKGVLVLKSLNERYAPYPVRRDEIQELWRFAGYFDSEFPLA